MPLSEQQGLDERFMREALAEAHAAESAGEVPIGAVVVREGEIIARAHNRREVDEDPSAHAEFSALLAAARKLGRWRLSGCTVYVTLEPCTMCAGLMVNARVDRCVYGAADPKGGALGSLYHLHADDRLNHEFAVTPGVLADECGEVLREFFARLREERKDRAQSGSAALSTQQAAPTRGQQNHPEQPPLRVLLAVDSFKGSATSTQAEAWIAAGIRRGAPRAQVTSLPIADGGEGTLAALQAACGGELRTATVSNPFGAPVAARYLLAGDTAVIEAAEAVGLAFSPRTNDAALHASTEGVGQLVRAALEAGAATIYLGMGGSCTNDGGAGFLASLGAHLLDTAGDEFAPGLAGLTQLASIDLSPALDLLAGTRLVALSDVTNPLVGRSGALATFGPQKGLRDPAAHDHLLVAYARLLDAARPATIRFRSVAGVPGAGAAGGLGAAVLALGGELTSGIDTILNLAGFDEAARNADLVITGEGRADGQSAHGKALAGIGRRAKRLRKPVIAIAGGRAQNLDALYEQGIDLVLTAPRKPMALDAAMTATETEKNLICAGEAAARAYFLAQR